MELRSFQTWFGPGHEISHNFQFHATFESNLLSASVFTLEPFSGPALFTRLSNPEKDWDFPGATNHIVLSQSGNSIGLWHLPPKIAANSDLSDAGWKSRCLISWSFSKISYFYLRLITKPWPIKASMYTICRISRKHCNRLDEPQITLLQLYLAITIYHHSSHVYTFYYCPFDVTILACTTYLFHWP